jgi:nucleoside phosphorylase
MKKITIFPHVFEQICLTTKKVPWVQHSYYSESVISEGENGSMWVLCGEGKVQAAMVTLALASKYPQATFLLAGSAGTLPEVELGSVLVVENVVEYDFNKSYSPCPVFSIWGGEAQKMLEMAQKTGNAIKSTLISGDRDLDLIQKKSYLSIYNAQGVTWESAGFARVVRKLGINGAEVRVAVDTAELPTIAQYKQLLAKACAQNKEFWESLWHTN